MKKLLFLLTLSLFIFSNADSQLLVKRFRIGLKLGLPNVAGAEAEVVLPGLGNRLAPFLGMSYLAPTINGNQQKFFFWEAGGNIYPLGNGKWLYASLSYSHFNFDGYYSGNQTYNGDKFTGYAQGNLSFGTFNTKIGVRFGGLFFVKAEVGYGFGSIPQKITISGVAYNSQGIKYTGTGVTDIPKVPLVSPNGIFLLNLGFGFAF